MAYTNPPTFTASTTATASDVNILSEDIRYLKSAIDALSVTGARARRAATQSLSTATPTYVSFDTEDHDAGGWFAATSTTLTVPASAVPSGYTTILLQVTASVEFASNSNGVRKVDIQVNGADNGSQWVDSSTGMATRLTLANTVIVSAGDTIKLQVEQTSGGALNVLGAWLSAYRIGPAA